MKKIFTLALMFVMLFSLVYSPGIAEEQDVPAKRSVLSVLPMDSFIVVEGKIDKLKTLDDCKSVNLTIQYINKFWSSYYPDSVGLNVLKALPETAFTGTACFGVFPVEKRMRAVVCAEIAGDAQAALATMFSDEFWGQNRGEIDGFPVMTIDYTRWSKLYIAVLDNLVVLSDKRDALVECISTYNQEPQNTYEGNPIWSKTEAWGENTVARGILDFSLILREEPAAALVFMSLGCQDPLYVSYRLDETGGRLEETVQMECLDELKTPALDLTGRAFQGLPDMWQ